MDDRNAEDDCGPIALLVSDHPTLSALRIALLWTEPNWSFVIEVRGGSNVR
jgi:hypothetical protein